MKPCPCALRASRVPAKRWLTRAELGDCLESARKEIADAPWQNPSLVRLAAIAGLSEHHFLRLFKDTFGQTPAQYRSQQKLNLARKLIQKGTPAGEAAVMAGYQSFPTFSRLYLQAFGERPSQTRNPG